jgi:uncharacterized protein (TIRG00374 family)
MLKDTLKTSFRLLVSTALLTYVILQVDPGECLTLLQRASLPLLLLLLGILIFERLFAAFRWYLLLRPRCPNVSLVTCLQITFLSGFAGSFLPGTIGNEAVRVYGMNKATRNLPDALTSVLLDRLMGVISLLICVFIGLALTARLLPDILLQAAVGCSMLLTFILIAITSRAVRRSVDRFTPEPVARFFRRPLKRIYRSLDAYRQHRRLLALSLALALLMQGVRILGPYVAAHALNLPHLALIDFVVFVPMIMFISMIPISVGGLGVRETAYARLFALVGMQPEAAITISLLIFVMDLLTTLPGALVYTRGIHRVEPASHREAGDAEPIPASSQ